MEKKGNFRESAGVLTAFLVVLAYVGIGFVQTAAVVFLGQAVQMPPDWMAAMLSLASAALGFLIGKQIGPDTPVQPPTGAFLPTGATTPQTTQQTPLPLPPAPG